MSNNKVIQNRATPKTRLPTTLIITYLEVLFGLIVPERKSFAEFLLRKMNRK